MKNQGAAAIAASVRKECGARVVGVRDCWEAALPVKAGGEGTINSVTDGTQTDSNVGDGRGGDYVATWVSQWLCGQRFDVFA